MRALLLSALLGSALLPLPLPAAGESLSAEARTARDVTALDLGKIDAASGDVWAVLTIDAAPSSGKVRFPGVTIGDGKVTTAPGAHTEATVEGRAAVVELLSGRLEDRAFSYRWPLDFVSPRGEDAALYSPFRRGGTALVRLTLPDERIAGPVEEAGRLAPVFLIPESWRHQVGPAHAVLRKEAALFAGPPSPQRQARLRKLLAAENPFVAIAAFQALAGDPQSAAVLERRIAAAHGLEQAAFVYLALSRAEAGGKIAGAPLAAVGSPGKPVAAAEPRGLGVGGAAAWLYGGSPATRDAGQALLSRLRAARVFPETGANRDLAVLLQSVR